MTYWQPWSAPSRSSRSSWSDLHGGRRSGGRRRRRGREGRPRRARRRGGDRAGAGQRRDRQPVGSRPRRRRNLDAVSSRRQGATVRRAILGERAARAGWQAARRQQPPSRCERGRDFFDLDAQHVPLHGVDGIQVRFDGGKNLPGEPLPTRRLGVTRPAPSTCRWTRAVPVESPEPTSTRYAPAGSIPQSRLDRVLTSAQSDTGAPVTSSTRHAGTSDPALVRTPMATAPLSSRAKSSRSLSRAEVMVAAGASSHTSATLSQVCALVSRCRYTLALPVPPAEPTSI